MDKDLQKKFSKSFKMVNIIFLAAQLVFFVE